MTIAVFTAVWCGQECDDSGVYVSMVWSRCDDSGIYGSIVWSRCDDSCDNGDNITGEDDDNLDSGGETIDENGNVDNSDYEDDVSGQGVTITMTTVMTLVLKL